MTYYERYARIAEQMNLDPCSQQAADLFGLTKATISSWNIKSTTPKGETVAIMADKLGVSADYLLGRTDDPTDFTKKGIPVGEFISAEKISAIRKPTISAADASVLRLLNRLDAADRLRAEGVIQGLLMQDKYNTAMPNAAHARTDIPVTPEMVAHDEDIMNSDEF